MTKPTQPTDDPIRHIEGSDLVTGTIRVGICCPVMALKIWATKHQTYVECYACQCRCINPGEDDGQTTCWTHHNCFNGDCTHMDVDHDDEHEAIDEND